MSTQAAQSLSCWNCGQPAGRVHFCEHCGSLQPPSGDYFEYFGLPHKLQIDLAALEKTFYSLSRRLHPDIYFQRPERERQLSEEATARLNDAYRALKDPVTRAEYLIRLHGIKQREEKATQAPPELLEEVFELKMALEQIRSGDSSVRPQLVAARSKFEALLDDAARALEACFAEWDKSGQRETLEAILRVLNRRSYILNLLAGVNAALV